MAVAVDFRIKTGLSTVGTSCAPCRVDGLRHCLQECRSSRAPLRMRHFCEKELGQPLFTAGRQIQTNLSEGLAGLCGGIKEPAYGWNVQNSSLNFTHIDDAQRVEVVTTSVSPRRAKRPRRSDDEQGSNGVEIHFSVSKPPIALAPDGEDNTFRPQIGTASWKGSRRHFRIV